MNILPLDIIRVIASFCNERTSNRLLSTSRIYLKWRFNNELRIKISDAQIEDMVKYDAINTIKNYINNLQLSIEERHSRYCYLAKYAAKYYHTGILRYVSMYEYYGKEIQIGPYIHGQVKMYAYLGAIAGNHDTLIEYYKMNCWPDVLYLCCIESGNIQTLKYYFEIDQISFLEDLFVECVTYNNILAVEFLLQEFNMNVNYINFIMRLAKEKHKYDIVNYLQTL